MTMPASIVKADSGVPLPERRVLGVAGSPRRNGNCDVLVRQVLKGVSQEDVASSLVQLRGIHFQGCIGCEKCRKDKICTGLDDGMSSIYSQIIDSQGLVLVSPAHNYNITSWMKAFIDRLYCFYDFAQTRPRAWSSRLAGQDRKAVVVAVCEQETEKDMGFTLEAMRIPIEALGYEVIGEQAVFGIFDRGKVKEDAESMEKASVLGRELAKSLREIE